MQLLQLSPTMLRHMKSFLRMNKHETQSCLTWSYLEK